MRRHDMHVCQGHCPSVRCRLMMRRFDMLCSIAIQNQADVPFPSIEISMCRDVVLRLHAHPA
jgi:hypothetical protein